MASYHLSVQVITRQGGRSATAAAAYRAGSRIVDRTSGEVHDYTAKGGVVYSAVLLPEQAPERWLDREVLWNEVEETERAKNAQLCREIVLAVPHEIPPAGRVHWVLDRADEMCVSRGMVVDVAIHDPGGDGHNIHAHILSPLRSCDANGFLAKSVNVYTLRNLAGDELKATAAEFKALKNDGWEKVYKYKLGGETVELTRSQAEGKGLDPTKDRTSKAPVQETRYLNDWNEKERVQEWREQYEHAQNQALERLGSAERVSCRTLKEQGIDRLPTVHEGPAVRAMEQRAQAQAKREGRPYEPVTDTRKHNIEIEKTNSLIAQLKQQIAECARRIYERGQQLIARIEQVREQRQQPAEPTPNQAIKAWEQAVQAERRADARLTDANRRDPDQGDVRCGEHLCWRDMVKADLDQAKAELAKVDTRLDQAKDRLHDLERHTIINRSKIPAAHAEVAKAQAEHDKAKAEVARLTASYQSAKLDYAKALVETKPAKDAWEAEVAKAKADIVQAKDRVADRLVEVNKALDRMPPAEALKALEDRWISEVRSCTAPTLRVPSDVTERQAERAARSIADPVRRYAVLTTAAWRLNLAGSHLAAGRVSDLATAAYRQIPTDHRQQADRTASDMADRQGQRFDAAMARSPEPVVNQPAQSLDLRTR